MLGRNVREGAQLAHDLHKTTGGPLLNFDWTPTDLGQASADESLNEIINFIQGSNMVFITAGMGGGTGTGASHYVP